MGSKLAYRGKMQVGESRILKNIALNYECWGPHKPEQTLVNKFSLKGKERMQDIYIFLNKETLKAVFRH